MLLAIAASLALLGATSAGADDGREACTLIGCDSAVTAGFAQTPADAFGAQICVDGRCGKTHRLVREAGADVLTQRLTNCQRQAGRRVKVIARVFDQQRGLIASDNARATVRRLRPNGPRCPPVCFMASLRFRGDTGRLTPRSAFD